MIDLQKLLTWSYGFERRHIALVATGLVFTFYIVLTTVFGGEAPLLTLLSLSFPVAGIYAMRKASLSELKTLCTWALITIVASGIVRLSAHQAIAPEVARETFTETTLVGNALAVPAVVAMIFLLIASFPFVSKLVDQQLDGGSGGKPSSPEEKVLSESEFEDFEPIEESKALFQALHGEITETS